MTHYSVGNYSARNSVGYLLRRSGALMRDRLELALADHGFTFAQWVTLVLVRDDATLTPGDLCRDLHHDSGAFTRILAQLECRRYLRRRRSTDDRRIVRLQLTAGGRKAVDATMPAVIECLNDAMEGFSAAEVTMLTRLLVRLIARLEAPADDHSPLQNQARA
jgi:DNA-binding MarR family transcriptional regulator